MTLINEEQKKGTIKMQDFSIIYEKSVKKVYHFLLKLCKNPVLAEELTAETFYQAFLHVEQFEGRCEIDTWLCQIAKNAYAKEMKRTSRHKPFEDWPNDVINEYEKLEDKEQALQLHKFVHELNEPYREVFMLKVFGDLSFKEIAGICDKSESWAKMTYYRAKAQIVEKMEEESHDRN